jgi:hypothetical protein
VSLLLAEPNNQRKRRLVDLLARPITMHSLDYNSSHNNNSDFYLIGMAVLLACWLANRSMYF